MKIKGNNNTTRSLRLRCLSTDLNLTIQFAPSIFCNRPFSIEEYGDEASIMFEDTYEIDELIKRLQELKKECEYGYFGKFVKFGVEKK